MNGSRHEGDDIDFTLDIMMRMTYDARHFGTPVKCRHFLMIDLKNGDALR